MNEQKKHKKLSLTKYIPMIICFVIGGAIGFLLAEYFIESKDFTYFVAFLVAFIVGSYLQIIIHEAGHLVFGLLTGYKFCSFRIMSFTWIKEKDKIRFKKFSLAGTAGQCLMSPPDMKDGKFPVALYNLGGSLMNIIASLIFLAGFFVFRDVSYVSDFFITSALVGFMFAMTNGIPMKMNGVNNDGHNAFSISHNEKSMRSFWLQLKINALQTNGVRLKDMSEEWFEYPSYDEMNNSMIATIAVLSCNRMMDNHDFENANKTMTELLVSDASMIEIHRKLLLCDRIYCELISGNNEEATKLMDKKQKQFMKSMKSFPAVMRTEYTYALLCENNSLKAEKIKKVFDKRLASYPYAGEAQMEQEFVNIAMNRLVKKEV